jgi:putative ABC transport system permease protein
MSTDEIDKELRFHVDARTADLVAAGLDAEEARRRAHMEFGGVLQTSEACRDERHSQFLAHARQDVSYALRAMRRDPAFAAIAVLCLGLGIGASTAMFSVIDNLLFRPPQFEHVDRLVCLFDTHPTKVPADAEVPPSPGNMLDWHDRARSFDYMVAWRNWYYSLSDAGAGAAESLRGVRVSASFFSMLGVRAALGRTFVDSESQAGRDQVVMLSHSLWLRRYGADPAIVGRKILIDARPFTVIGVLPGDFQFYQPDLDVWMPLDLESIGRDRQNHSVMVFARLAPGATAAEAQSELDAITRDLAREHPDTNSEWGARIVPLYPSRDVRDVRAALIVLLVASATVLLIACVNVANLVLGRGIARHREIVIRAAIGASRARLVRQMLTESLVLAAAGAVIGGAVAVTGVRLLVPLLPHAGTNQTLATFGPIRPTLDLRVLTFAVVVTIFTGMLFGLLPALQTTRADFLRSTSSSAPSRAGRVLVVAELTLSIMLLVSASLLLESFWRLQRVDPGFRADHLLTMPVWLPRARYEGAGTTRFYEDVIRRVERLPGVRSVGAVSYRPFLGMAMSTRFETEGVHAPSARDLPTAGYDVVTPGYLGVLEQPLDRGRDLSETDTAESPGVAVVNEAMASRFWPGQDPLGKRIRPAFSRTDVPWAMDAQARWLTIVGVAANIKEFRLTEQPRPIIYISARQFPSSFMYLMIRTSVPPEVLVASARREVMAVDPNQPISTLQTMEAAVANAVPRFDVELFVIFAAIALFLSAIGVYGVTSHGVTERTREIGIRMALGASARDMVAMVLRETLVVSVLGAVFGTLGAAAATRAMRNMLYGVSPGDAGALAGASLILIGAALVASYLPARRAARLQPTIALKWD